jgi:chemotaxis protein histidine kinase CheA
MSSNAEELNARLAALTKAREEKEAHCKREEEQERLEEELLQKELKRVEAAEKKRKEEEWKRREMEEKQRKEEVKAVLAVVEAKKRVEVEQGKKRGRAGSVEVVIGTRMMDEKGMVWFAQEGVVCRSCMNSGDRCMWRDLVSTWAKACWPCILMKKECPVPEARRAGVAKGNVESGPKAGSLKKRKLVLKGKGKEKEREVSESEVGADASAALLAEVKGLREDTCEVAVIG